MASTTTLDEIVTETGEYDRLIRPFEEQMLQSIGRIVRDADRAEDTLQEAVTKLWDGRTRLASHPNPRAYVLSVCLSVAHDALRRLKRQAAARAVMEAEARGRSDSSEPSEAVEARELADEVLAALSKLPSQQATAVLLRLMHEQSYADVAASLDCSETTARTHVARGRETLSRLLAHLAPGSPSKAIPGLEAPR